MWLKILAMILALAAFAFHVPALYALASGKQIDANRTIRLMLIGSYLSFLYGVAAISLAAYQASAPRAGDFVAPIICLGTGAFGLYYWGARAGIFGKGKSDR